MLSPEIKELWNDHGKAASIHEANCKMILDICWKSREYDASSLSDDDFDAMIRAYVEADASGQDTSLAVAKELDAILSSQ